MVKEPQKPSDDDLEKRFSFVHTKKDLASTDRYELIHRLARGLARELVAVTPACREQSLALTKLEESLLWTNVAIGRG